MLGNILPKSAVAAGAMGAVAVFVARQIPPVEKFLDRGKDYAGKELPIPHIAKSSNGYPLGYAVAPLVLAIALHKFL